jgi:hypothetical protein
MYEEKTYQVKYYLLMLNPLQKALIGIEDNLTHDKLIKCLENRLEAYFYDCKAHYPKSTFFINFQIIKKKGNLYQPKSIPVEVFH